MGEAMTRPFRSAGHYMAWTDANCCRCAKQATPDASLDEMPCEIEAALTLAQLDGGLVPLPITDRMGCGPACKELELSQ